jgi:hypothetical protein
MYESPCKVFIGLEFLFFANPTVKLNQTQPKPNSFLCIISWMYVVISIITKATLLRHSFVCQISVGLVGMASVSKGDTNIVIIKCAEVR